MQKRLLIKCIIINTCLYIIFALLFGIVVSLLLIMFTNIRVWLWLSFASIAFPIVGLFLGICDSTRKLYHVIKSSGGGGVSGKVGQDKKDPNEHQENEE